MLKYLFIAILAFAGWMYFTDSGRAFYAEHLKKKEPEAPKFVPDQVLVQRIDSEMNVVKRKLEQARKDLKAREIQDANARAVGKRVVFATDVNFLQRSIDRLEEEESSLRRQMDRVMTGK